MGAKRMLLTAVIAGAVASGAQAAERASTSFVLAAEVAPFCRIDSGEREVGADGIIGAVTEVCNMPGYSVRADFANLASGQVVAGDERVTLAGEASAVFTSPEARRRVRTWQLASAVRQDPAAPVVVRFSISPL